MLRASSVPDTILALLIFLVLFLSQLQEVDTLCAFHDEKTKVQIAEVTCSRVTEGPGSAQQNPGI